MYKLIEERGTGKTKQLMSEAYTNNGIFVCQNAIHMREKANAYGFTGLKIISFRDFIDDITEHNCYADVMIRGYKDGDNSPIYIDELEGFMNYLCLNKFKGYTITTGIL